MLTLSGCSIQNVVAFDFWPTPIAKILIERIDYKMVLSSLTPIAEISIELKMKII